MLKQCGKNCENNKPMNRVLYADLACPNGHVNYNRIMINALVQVEDVDIVFFMQEGYAKKISESLLANKTVYEVPSYKKSHFGPFNRIKYRLHQFQLQNKLYRLARKEQYELVFLSSFDIVAFIFFKKLPCKTVAVCHNEIDVAVKKKKTVLLKIFSRHCNLVSINNSGYCFLSSLGLKAYMIPHGFPQPFEQESVQVCRHIYIPINGAIDWNIVGELLTDGFNDLLKAKNARLIIKSRDKSLKDQYAHLSQIDFLVGYIDNETYKQKMLGASIILLPYLKEEYQYRCSAILMEAIINNKAVILPNVSVFKEFSLQGDSGLHYYDDINSLVSIIKNYDFEHYNVHYDNVKSLYSRDAISTCFNALIHEK